MNNETTASGWIAFDNVDIDVTGHRLLINGEEVALERKAFAVLVLLAREPGRVFGRDEILDAVWGHSHVTPSVLNRIVTVLRHALGENADASRYLSTVHGIGYRFDAVLRVASSSALAASTVAAGDMDEGTGPPSERPTSSAEPPQSLSASAPDPFGPTRQPRRFVLPVLLIVTALLGAGYWLSRTKPMPVSTTPVLVILPLRTVGDAHDENILAEGLSEELTTRLARVDGLRMISSTSAALAQSGKFDLPQLADKLKVTHALEGSLREDGDQLRIDLRLLEVPGGKTLWAQDYDRKLAGVFALESEIAQAVAGALALRLGIASNASAADIDPGLLQRMLEARTVLRNPASYPGKDPETLMRGLLAEHPDYAPARGLLALVLSLKLPPGDTPQRATVQREAERAIQLDPNLPEPYIALSRCANEVADWDRAIAMYQKALQLAPTDSVYRSTYGYVLGGLGYVDEGLHQAEIGAASDPLNAIALAAQARMLDTVGRHDEAKKFSQPSTIGAYASWLNAAWRHDQAGMRAALGAMPGSPGNDIWNDSYAAATAAQEDAQRWPEAHAAIEESERRARAQHLATPFNYIRLLDPHTDYATVFAGLDMSLRNTYPTMHLMIWMSEYRAARQTPEFQDYLRRNHILDYWRAHGFPPQCKPEGDGAKCD